MRIYWDQILVDTSGGDRPCTTDHARAADGAICDGAASRRRSRPDGREPFGYDYERVSTSPWKVMPGPLHARGRRAAAADARRRHVRDRRPGDELALAFDAGRAAAAPRRAGRARSCCYADGFSKEMDIRSATPDSARAAAVPRDDAAIRTAPGEHYPDAAAHRDVPGALQHARRRARRCRRSTQRQADARASLAMTLRYSAAACQTDFANPLDRRADGGEHRSHARDDRRRRRRRGAVPAGAARRVSGVRARGAGLRHRRGAARQARRADSRTSTPTARTRKAREHDIYIQSGSMIEADPRWPGVVFNTTCLIGPEGILYKYRKVNPWIPYEVHASPHDLAGYDEPLFPVADTPIGRIGCAICYDWLFPEAIRQLAANGAEVLIRVSAYMDPWGATEPMNWWTLVNRCRALENIAYVVAANQGASLRHYPPYSWPGGSQVVDFDGRMLAEASPGPGERIVVAPIDIVRAAPRARDAARPSHARAPAHRGLPGVLEPHVPGRRQRALVRGQ